MVKHTRRRGGTWYDPRTWFSSSTDSAQSQSQGASAIGQTDYGMGASSPAASTALGGRKGKKSRRTKRRGTKSRRKH